MTWKSEIQALDLSDANKKEILEIVETEIKARQQNSYDEGYREAELDHSNDEPDTSWLDDLETGLRLIDTDRTAAKVYLDRCTKQAGYHLIEVVPCLL